MQVLVINCGSSSVKYALLDPDAATPVVTGLVERISGPEGYVGAVKSAFDACAEQSVDAVGHRVVHGGERFFASAAIDDEVLAAIEACVPLAPLHNPANLAGIRAARSLRPDLPHVAVFDTAFHSRMPRRAKTYALDPEVLPGARRFGFHGTSHAYVTRRAAEHLGRPLAELRLISCHLGNGASVAAVEYGQSVDTSMGMTPLEGLVMGTRSGDLDPGLVLTLVRDGRSADEVDALLNQKSGLAGLSGVSHDLRDIEAAAAEGDDRARLAINVFAHRVKKYIGAYTAVMGGVDAVILTGGIGENGQAMRRRVLQRLEVFGILVDEGRNLNCPTAEEDVVDISAANARTPSLVIRTDEARMIARDTASIASGLRTVDGPAPIPIAVSARHMHLTRETLEALFGPEQALTKYKDISQPGQFASEQRVSIVGPRGRIDGVRVLGPLRPKNQVEISRTDEYRLGVDAPVRRSGHVQGSAPIVLEGPAGTVHLEEGLICAWRHIHMTPEDAALHGVENGDEVEVSVRGGPRDLTFGDVLVRVSDKYVTEMHIDTDEANAAEIGRGATGELVYTPAGAAAAEITAKKV